MVGGNYRMPEVEAAISIEQLKKLPDLLDKRIELANYLTEKLSKLDFLSPPKVRSGSDHVYYLYPLKYHEEQTGLSREKYIDNIRELGINLYRFAGGYIRPLYLEQIFAQKDQLKNGYPYSILPKNDQPCYLRGICPVTERLYDKEMIVTAYNYPPLTKTDMDDIVKAFTLGAKK
jgi:dTDP-4-amino-4,6-dideoxygalactose transaminase